VSLKIAVASGKGGTGKTTVAVALALALESAGEPVQFLDCDVEEPNADLLVRPTFDREIPVTVDIPKVDMSKCTGRGECREICQFNAIAVVKNKAMIFEQLCHSCGGCALACPNYAIREEPKVVGRVELGSRGGLRFLKGVLNVSEPMAPPVIRALRQHAAEGITTVLDAPPGTACPVIATVRDCDYVVLVTEPTPFGLYDLGLMVDVVKDLGIPAGIVINKHDTWSANVESYAASQSIPVLLTIPFSRDTAVEYSKGIPLNQTDRSWNLRFQDLYEGIEAAV
jgi:MinD superfamily P-loop ATPase